MPAASFIAKVSNMNPILSWGHLEKVNTLFNNGEDELFKKIVVDNFLFRYKRIKGYTIILYIYIIY